MATKKKTSPAKRISRPARKPASRAKTSKRKKTGITGEIKKICIGIVVLTAFCLSAAMIADICFHPGGGKSPVAVLTPFSFQKQSAKVSHGNQKTDLGQSDTTSDTGKKASQVPGIREIEKKHKNTFLKEKNQAVTGVKDKKTTQITQTGKVLEPIALKEKKQDRKIQKERTAATPVYEVFHEADSSESFVKSKIFKKSGALPKLVVIIDDIGFDKEVPLGLCDVDSRITFSVLPWSPFGEYLADKLAARGALIMLHLPMEPVGYPKVDPGPGALLTTMTPDALLEQLRKDLGAIPHIVGVNNHMGSRLTTSDNQMNQVFTILKKEGLFFIDSRTSVNSKCASAARLLQIPFAQRDVFLDNVQNVSYISKQFALLVRIAKKHGSAIGIGHPYKETLASLAKEIPKLAGRVELVPAQTLVHVLE